MKKYIQTLFLSSMLVLMLLAGFNYVLDPLLLYPHQTVKPLDVKRQLLNFARAHKTAQIEYLEPELLVFGSSRAFDGIDVNQTYLKQQYKNSYNAALYNGTIHEMLALFNQALCQKKLKTMVIGLDFFVFNSQRPQFQKGGGSDFLQADHCFATKINIAKSLFNFSNLRFEKILNDRKMPVRLDVLPDGSLALESSAAQRKVPLAAALLSERNYVTMDGFYKNFAFSDDSFAALAQMIALATQHNIDVKIFISPSHVRRWEVLDFAIGMTEFERFKTKLTHLVSQYDTAHRVELWDFAVYHEFTTEPVTEKPMQWHWESSHYKKELGAEILHRLFEQSEQTADFGLKLSPQNIQLHLQQQRLARQQWLQANPTQITELKANLNSALASER